MLTFKGSVQGVGFRPFVFNLAKKLGLKGYVRNAGLNACVLLDSLNYNFIESILKNFEVLEFNIEALPYKKAVLEELKSGYFWEGFKIFKSIKDTKLSLNLPLDFATCKGCMQDATNPNSRFFNYAFCACAKCGPRYSLIKSLPYDRSSTTMSDFTMCKECLKEYESPTDRRFHTELISCETCGMKLKLIESKKLDFKSELDILKRAAMLLKEGKILALKGITGYALICDAKNLESVLRLRALKHRKTKPIALMAEVSTIDKLVRLDLKLRAILLGQSSPMVIAPKLKNLAPQMQAILKEISPNNTLAITRPFSAHLSLLFSFLPDYVLCFTSANLKGAHIAKSAKELKGLEVDGVLTYNRVLTQSLDDSIVCISGDFLRGIRFSRGIAPFSMKLKSIESKSLIAAFGAHSKTSLTFLQGDECISSPYISNLDSLENIEHLRNTFLHFCALFGKPTILVCDANSSYESTKLAKSLALESNIKLLEIYHHHAHFIALCMEAKVAKNENVLAFIWDGSGLGLDLKLWGGEVFSGSLDRVQDIKRVFHFKYFYLMRNEASIKDAQKTTFFMFKSLGVKIKNFNFENENILEALFDKRLNLIESSSLGRIFDVVAFMLGLVSVSEYEGQSGELIASLASKGNTFLHSPYSYKLTKDEIDLKEMFEGIAKDLDSKEKCFIANRFLDTLADIALNITLWMGQKKAAFGGGVFLNMLLCEKIQRQFKTRGLEVFFPFLPSGDYSISIGQAGYAALLESKEAKV
nr:carbamoyltransferase HypF [Helicobacter sp. 13S00401-1]